MYGGCMEGGSARRVNESESGSVPSMLHNNSGMEISERKKTKDGTSDGTLPSPTQERIR